MPAFLPLLVHDLIDFIYPRLCYACDAGLPRGVLLKCPSCQHHLVITDMHLVRDNEVRQRLAGRLELSFAASMYRFYKGSRVQTMIHRWKYQNFPGIGVHLGREYGQILKDIPELKDLEAIVPVPLHPDRLKWRGYNQAETFARGLSEQMAVSVNTNMIIREKRTGSQTAKGRQSRIETLWGSFIRNPRDRASFPGGHFLLVDDILTTGATLEAFARPFLDIPGVRLSLVTVAIGQK